MKDLFVYTADSDALALIRSVLGRPKTIGIRPITCEVDRHTGRDSGMLKEGPETVRFKVPKAEFQRVILIWDYHGSGETQTPSQSRDKIRLRLRQVTWEDRSEALVIVPEIEEWLWYDDAAIARNLAINAPTLHQHIDSFAGRENTDAETCKARYPKELFEYCLFQARRRKPRPDDFERIATTANLVAWQGSDTFENFVAILRTWFPKKAQRRPRPAP